MRPAWTRYTGATALVVIAALAKEFLDLKDSPFLAFFSAVMLSAWFWGRGPGLLSTVLGTVAAGIFYFKTFYLFPVAGSPVLHLCVFALEGVAVSVTAGGFRANEKKSADSAEAAIISEGRYRQVLDSIGDYAIFTLCSEGRVMTWSAGGTKVTGWPEGEIVGQHFSVFYPEESVEAGLPRRELETATACGIYDVEGWRVRRDGSRYWAQVHIARLNDGSGGFVEVTRDATAQKEAEETAQKWLDYERRAREQAESHNRLKDEFLATLSHELRTPLTMVIGWADLLRNPNIPSESARAALEAIGRNAYMLTQLVDDLLDVSRIITGKMVFNPQPVDLAPLIEAAIETVRPAAAAKGITIRCLFDTSAACCVNGVPSRLQQILWNLLSNAIKFTPGDGQVEVTLEQAGSSVQVKVRDTGQGITPDFLPHVFERFSQADSSKSRQHGGLGLGLAIVRHLVEMHGGTVRADSEGPGSGATFTLRLPVLAVREGAAEARGSGALSGLGAEPLKGLSVLLVDDDDSTRDLLLNIVRLNGGEARTAASGPLALELLKGWSPDVLVSDVSMPVMTGYEFVGRVRETPGVRGVPALALTAHSTEGDRLEALAAGFNAWKSKPVDPQELVRAIAELAGRGPRRESTAA